MLPKGGVRTLCLPHPALSSYDAVFDFSQSHREYSAVVARPLCMREALALALALATAGLAESTLDHKKVFLPATMYLYRQGEPLIYVRGL